MFDKKKLLVFLLTVFFIPFGFSNVSAKSMGDSGVLNNITEACACAEPAIGETWKNHGEYVSCVAHAANTLVSTGSISKNDKGEIVSEAARSSCGKAEDGTVINPLDIFLLEPDGLTLEGVSTTSFNPRVVELKFVLAGTEFFQDISDVTLTINGAAVLESNISLTATGITAAVNLADGKNNIALKAYDIVGRSLYLTKTVWAGSNLLRVNLVDTDGMPFFETANIKLSLSDDSDIVSSGSTNTGTLIFENVPSRTVVAEAGTVDNLFGVIGGVGNEGTFEIRMLGFDALSTVDNNDLSLGTTEGWNTGSSPVAIIEHVEGFPTTLVAESSSVLGISRKQRDEVVRNSAGSRKTTEFAVAAFADNDLELSTSGEGSQSISRKFTTQTGTTSVVIRYRFVTSEVPGGYFGSKFNDYFSVTLRSQTEGDIESESNTMNGLGLGAFDFASGATEWRTVTLDTEPEGDEIQVNVTVANVADGLLDSSVIIDFIEEKQDKVQPALAWNSTAGGLTLTYTVEESELEEDVTIEVFWAAGTTYDTRIGAAFFSHVVPAGTAVGPGGPIAIPGTGLENNPNGTTHLLAASSETKVGSIADVSINYGANADAGVVSAVMIDIVEDGLRTAGQTTATITSTARAPADQARAMFQNLVNPANTLATNIANQLALYAPPGDAVINVFVAQTAGLTLAQINTMSATIQAAMEAEINAQGPSNVSRHCADPAQVSVVDVGGGAFGTNGSLFVDSVTPRVARFINEITTNNAYHLER